MSHKLGVCIPYRNRKEHLDKLIPQLSEYLNKKGIDHKFYVGHQVDFKLFNRGSMKNIAAHTAFNDGCDYIAWHDVDMVPCLDENYPEPDYSYPKESPVHIATKLSKYEYGMGYDQYFGGVVLFTKEQVEATNGYSNDYWDWGQEDDDLFWRCYFEKYTSSDKFKNYENKIIAKFNGENSFLRIPTNREISGCLRDDHTISILFKAEQQQEKVPIWLVGDDERKFIEYPMLRKDNSWTWGLSFNNSRAVSHVFFDKNHQHGYIWGKRFENLWTWVTVAYSKEESAYYFYINDELQCNINDIKKNTFFPIENKLKSHDGINPFLIGFCSHLNTFFKGEIAEIKIFNRFVDNVEESIESNEGVVLDCDFNKIDDIIGENNNVEFYLGNIEIIQNILPYRIEGTFDCLPHIDEGYVGGKWAKGETTAKNEKRFVTEMQQNKINYKTEGFNKITEVTEVIDMDTNSYPNTVIINTKMI
jgi:hypothetical protein